MNTAIPKEQLISRAKAVAEEMSVRVYEGGGETAVIDAHLAEIALASLQAKPAFYMEVKAVIRLYEGISRFGTVTKEPKEGKKTLPLFIEPQPVMPEGDRAMLNRLSVILSGSDGPGELRSLTVTAQSFVDRCIALAKERDDLRKQLDSLVIPGQAAAS